MGALAPKVRAVEPDPDEAKGLGNAPIAAVEEVDANGAGAAVVAEPDGAAEEPKVNVGAAAAGGAPVEPAGAAGAAGAAAAAVDGPLLAGAMLPNENPPNPAAPAIPDDADAVVVDAEVVPKANPPVTGAGAFDVADVPGAAAAAESADAPVELSAARCANAMPKGIDDVEPLGVPLLRGGLPALEGDLAGGNEKDRTEPSAAGVAELVAAMSLVASEAVSTSFFVLSAAIVGAAAAGAVPKEKPVTGAACGAAAGAPPKEKLRAAGGPAVSFFASVSKAVDFSVDWLSFVDVVLLVAGFSVARGSPNEIVGGLLAVESPATLEEKENDGAPLVAEEVKRGPLDEESPTAVAGVFPVIGVATTTRRRFVVVSVSQEFNDSTLTSSSRCSFRKTRKNMLA